MTRMINIPAWFYYKLRETSDRYHCYIDVYNRGENGSIPSDVVMVQAQEVLKETEKAIQVKLITGGVDGSYKGWTTWIPKSLIK